ncbi:MAG TPA: alkaline phosphatase family protein [Acetobacteraceae bacterium]|nr:alkaline phosphatase family protein [Acetobacteraceae bacterium]
MAKIAHLVVLMLENRSFDNFLGKLYPAGPGFDALTGDEWNPLHERDGSVRQIGVWNAGRADPDVARIPDPDPGELFEDINEQLFGLGGRPCAGPPPMSGFVDNYMRQPAADKAPDPRAVMHYFTAAELPATFALARAFGVSDRWFASAPCQTWPNRLFVHTGGNGRGRVNNTALPHPFFARTIYPRLRRHGLDWRVYFHDLPQTASFVDLWPSLFRRFRLFEKEFAADAAAGRLPAYSFIEPRYLPGFLHKRVPNDAHPPHDVGYSEMLVADTYNALRASPAWERTLLVILADEHGGCYDHAPPPAAVEPGGPYVDGFRFDRYGPRVPAILASPWIPAGAVIRPPQDGPPFDHTSLIATLCRLFGLGPEPTPRAAAAPDLLEALSLPRPENHGPERIDVTRTEPARDEVRALRRAPRNGHQKTLLHPLALAPALLARGSGHVYGFRRRRKRRPS